MLHCSATRGLLATDHVISNHGQGTWTTPELAPPLLTTTPHQREDVSALDRFNLHRCPTRRVFSGTELELVTRQATIRYPYHSATAADIFFEILLGNGVTTDIPFTHMMSGVSYPKGNRGYKLLVDREPKEMFCFSLECSYSGHACSHPRVPRAPQAGLSRRSLAGVGLSESVRCHGPGLALMTNGGMQQQQKAKHSAICTSEYDICEGGGKHNRSFWCFQTDCSSTQLGVGWFISDASNYNRSFSTRRLGVSRPSVDRAMSDEKTPHYLGWYWARTRDKASHSPIPIPLGYRGHVILLGVSLLSQTDPVICHTVEALLCLLRLPVIVLWWTRGQTIDNDPKAPCSV
ncbi:uncharacterized protein TNCV_3009961 [Trichonephila clavipes]|nr:uncharacterized protein TNCV_3009961 [Trichonephila clavipes]